MTICPCFLNRRDVLKSGAVSTGKTAKRGLGEESTRRIRIALQAELRQSRRAKEIDAGIGRSRGYLYKFCRGDTTVQLGGLMAALDLLGLDPGRFFANALAAPIPNDEMLRDLEHLGAIDSRLVRLEQATSKLASTPPPEEPVREVDGQALVAKMAACHGVEQRRRLRQAERCRQPAFTRAYLEYLDALRYDNPKEAARNAEEMAVKLIPRLTGPQPERLALQLKALGVFGSAHRVSGGFSTAARAARVALALARKHRMPRVTADLLQRGAYALSDHGRFAEAMKLLDEALVIYFDLGSKQGLGQVMVDRGHMLNYLGEHKAAVQAFVRALRVLDNRGRQARRNILAAHTNLAVAYEHLGQFGDAEQALEEALTLVHDQESINKAKVVWQLGSIAMKRRSLVAGEKYFRMAAKLLEKRYPFDRALVTLDLTEALLAQGKADEATQIAVSTTEFLTPHRSNRVLEAATTKFLRLAIGGKLTVDHIRGLREQISRGRARQSGAPEAI